MQRTLMGSLFIALLASATAFAAEQHNHSQMNHEAMRQMDYAQMKVTPMTDGVVKKVDVQNGQIMLAHGEIANVKMPAMTMNYRVKQAQWLESIHAGDKVRFAIDKHNDEFVVVHIEAVK
ncbi:MAG: copper-binding protein [Gallionellaceae bacterium]|nr:copper-binding protein [Gallionellaceae bacterium]